MGLRLYAPHDRNPIGAAGGPPGRPDEVRLRPARHRARPGGEAPGIGFGTFPKSTAPNTGAEHHCLFPHDRSIIYLVDILFFCGPCRLPKDRRPKRIFPKKILLSSRKLCPKGIHCFLWARWSAEKDWNNPGHTVARVKHNTKSYVSRH